MANPQTTLTTTAATGQPTPITENDLASLGGPITDQEYAEKHLKGLPVEELLDRLPVYAQIIGHKWPDETPKEVLVPRRKLWVVRGNIESDVAAAVGSNDVAGFGRWSLTGRQNQFCLGHGDRRQALRLRRTASRLRGLTATRMAASSALVPSMTRSVRRRGGAASVLAAADVGGCQGAKELAAGCIEGALLGFGLAMGE